MADHEALHALMQGVEHPGIVAIAGMAGVGKTELAIQYGRSHREDYLGGVAWFSAATFGEAVRDWMQSEFCPDRDLRHLPDLTQQVALGWKGWQDFCGSQRLALVMIDDVTDYRQQIEPFLPQQVVDRSPFRFLLTSREHLVGSSPIPTLELKELDSEAAVAMLARFAGDQRIEGDRPTATSLCQRLANLPLAIALVGCWLSVDGDRTLTQLRESLEREGLEAPGLERDPQILRLTAERGVKAAFALSWQQVGSVSSSAQQLARVLTLFAPVDLSWERVEAVVQTYAQMYPAPEVSPPIVSTRSRSGGAWAGVRGLWRWVWQRLRGLLGQRPRAPVVIYTPMPIANALEARGTLLRLSLLQRVDGDRQVYRLHLLLREFFEAQWAGADPEGWKLAFAQAIAAAARQIPKEMAWEQAASFNDLQPQLPRAFQLLQDRAATAPDPATAARYKQQAGEIRAGRFRLSQPVLFEAAFEQALKTHTQAQAAAAAGQMALAQQKFTETLEQYREVVTKARATFPANSLQLAGYLNRLTKLFKDLGRYQDGIPPAEEAIRIATDRVKPVKLASYLNNLASLYESQGRYSEAEPLFVQALELRQRLLGEEHPDVSLSLNNLAGLYYSQGRYSEAEPLLVQALELGRRILGEEHPDVASSLNNLASLYESQGRYSEAEPLLVQSLEMKRLLLGGEHPDVARSLNNLAGLYYFQGRYSEAEPLLVQSFEMKRRLLGEEHPDVALSLNNLAELYKSQGRYSEAEQLYVQSLEMMRRLLGEEHPDVALSLNNLAVFYESQGRYSEAEPLYEQSLDIRERKLGTKHPYTVGTRNDLEEMRRLMGGG